MSKLYRMTKSRNNWKHTASFRGDKRRYLRREFARSKKQIKALKKEVKELKACLNDRENKEKTPAVRCKADLVLIVLLLFHKGHIGFRAVSRVLGVLSDYLGLIKAPCPQTVINWVQRMSVTRIQNSDRLVGTRVAGDPFSNGFVWMIDTSIALGREKILAVLAVKAGHHDLNVGAPSFQDVHCVAVGVAVSWTGESIADFLFKVINVLGRPVAFLKDGGTDLAKAVRILRERGYITRSIDDVSHVVANLLKHEYSDHPLFDTFISACGKASGKLKQTVLACLAPPKVSTKARFMNLHRLVVWADRLLKHSPTGRAANGSLLEKLRASMDRLPSCKSFIARFLRDAAPLLECRKILKTRGLSNETVKECETLVETIPPSSSVRIGFKNWMRTQLDIAEELGMDEMGLPISSDPLESLFGVVKTLGASQVKDANRIAIHLPAMCGQVTEEDARNVLKVSVRQQQQTMGNFPSLLKQRREILPNPGRLDNILSDQSDQRLELIPGTKNRSKYPKIFSISNAYRDSTGPPFECENKAVSSPNGHF